MIQDTKSPKRGFTLLELLVVIVVIGVIAAIALPHFTQALDRSKQRSTLVQMRNLGQSFLTWYIDQNGAASAGRREVFELDGQPTLNPEQVRAILEPQYLQHVETVDGWGNPLRFTLDGASGTRVLITSTGKDGILEGSYERGPFLATDFDRDIVWADSVFLRWPEGTVEGNR